MFKNAIILAGGKGIRMLPLTKYIPKGLVEINDKTLISGVIDLLNQYDVEDVYVTYNYLSEILFNEIKLDVKGFINTTNQDNSYFLFNSFVKYVNEPFIVISCDLKIELDLNKVYEDYIKLDEPALMIIGTEPNDDIVGDHIIFDESNNILSLDRDIPSPIYCTGVQIINPYKVNEICDESNNFYGVWEQLIKNYSMKLSNINPQKWYSFDNIKQVI